MAARPPGTSRPIIWFSSDPASLDDAQETCLQTGHDLLHLCPCTRCCPDPIPIYTSGSDVGHSSGALCKVSSAVCSLGGPWRETILQLATAMSYEQSQGMCMRPKCRCCAGAAQYSLLRVLLPVSHQCATQTAVPMMALHMSLHYSASPFQQPASFWATAACMVTLY